jgi:hypothetical protein
VHQEAWLGSWALLLGYCFGSIILSQSERTRAFTHPDSSAEHHNFPSEYSTQKNHITGSYGLAIGIVVFAARSRPRALCNGLRTLDGCFLRGRKAMLRDRVQVHL